MIENYWHDESSRLADAHSKNRSNPGAKSDEVGKFVATLSVPDVKDQPNLSMFENARISSCKHVLTTFVEV
jgi:hypothetical protein